MAGQIIKRSENTYTLRIFQGLDGGKRQYLNRTFHGNKKEAQRALNAMLRDQDQGTLIEPTRSSLNSYLDQWLDTAARPRVRPRTLASYQDVLRLYVRPRLGARPLAKLGPLDLQDAYAKLADDGHSARTIRYAHSILNSALKQAVKWKLLQTNPADHVELPRQQRREIQPLDQAQASHFLDTAAGTRHYTLFSLLLSTGLRPGEALGLRWDDFDAGTAYLSVQRGLAFTGKTWRLDEPKTARGRRRVKLPPSLAAELRAHRLEQHAARLAYAGEYHDHGLMFAAENGAPLDERNIVHRHFKPLLKRAALPSTLRLYDLRHTHATLLLLAGENPKVVSERLGHASVALTLDVYSHVLPSLQQGAADRLETMLYARHTG
jgi:integrase